MVGTCVRIEIVIGTVRPLRITSTRDRSPGAASLATSRLTSHHPMFCSDPLPLPLRPETVTPVDGEISADSAGSGLGIATLMTVVRPGAACRGYRVSTLICGGCAPCPATDTADRNKRGTPTTAHTPRVNMSASLSEAETEGSLYTRASVVKVPARSVTITARWR